MEDILSFIFIGPLYMIVHHPSAALIIGVYLALFFGGDK